MTGGRVDEGPREPDPARVRTSDDLVRELELLRRRAAYGTGKARVGLADLARRSGVPRSTVHTYVNGMRVPPPDVLDRLVGALGVTGPEQGRWADALDRVTDAASRTTSTSDAGTPGPTATTADETTAAPVPQDLPPAPRVFVGRADLLAALDPVGRDRHLAVLTGGGGMGKSALALHWAHREADRFPDGRLHIDLQGFGPRPARTTEEALAGLLRGLGVEGWSIPRDLDERVALWSEHTRGRRLLVVLDNARDATQVEPLLGGGPGVTTLVTSRDDLTGLVIAHDAVPVVVGPLDDADVDRLSALATGTDAPGAADATQLTEAMRRCAGMPLALRIVAERWRRGLSSAAAPSSPEELLDEVDLRRTDLGVRTTLGWTLDHLAPEARRTFRRIAAIPQAVVDETLVAVVAGVPVREARLTLEALAAVHLVDPVRDGFTMHDLVSAFAHERFSTEEPEDVRDEVVEALAHRVAVLCQEAGDQLESLGPVPDPLPGYGSGLLVDAEAVRLWFDRHLDTLVWLAGRDGADPRHRWLAASALGRRHHFFDPSLPVEGLLRGAAMSARRARDDRAVAVLENLLGICDAMGGDHVGAWRHMTVAARRHRLVEGAPGGVPGPGTAVVESNLAKLAGRLGRHDEAIETYRALIAAGVGEPDNLHLGMAEIAWNVDDLDLVREAATAVVEQGPSRMSHSTLPTAYHFLAQLEARAGRPARARALLEHVPASAQDVPVLAVDGLSTRLEIALAEGRHDDAADLGRQALRLVGSDDLHARCIALMDLADVELARDDVEAAAVWVAEARMVASPVGLHHARMMALARGVRLAHRLGDDGAARAELAELRALAAECGSSPVLAWADRLQAELGV